MRKYSISSNSMHLYRVLIMLSAGLRSDGTPHHLEGFSMENSVFSVRNADINLFTRVGNSVITRNSQKTTGRLSS